MRKISLSMLYLYAVGAVLVLGLFMPFDAMAGNSTLCVNGIAVYGNGTCATNNNNNNRQPNSQRYVLENYEAMHVMTSLNTMASGIDATGNFYIVGKYVGLKYREVQNRMFSCQAKADASAFYCVSWPVVQ